MAHKVHHTSDDEVPQADEKRDWKRMGLAACVVIVIILAAIFVYNGWFTGGDEDRIQVPNDDNDDVANASVLVVYSLQDGPFETITGSIRSPSEGYQFISAVMIIENVSYTQGVSSNAHYFELDANSIKYSPASDTYSHILYNTASSIMPGGQLETVVVFEVPESVDASAVTLEWDGIPATGVHMEQVGPGLPSLTNAPDGLLYNVGHASTSESSSGGMVTYTLPYAVHNHDALYPFLTSSDFTILVDGVEYRPAQTFFNVLDGQTVRGEMSYMIPEGSAVIELMFDDSLILWDGIPME